MLIIHCIHELDESVIAEGFYLLPYSIVQQLSTLHINSYQPSTSTAINPPHQQLSTLHMYGDIVIDDSQSSYSNSKLGIFVIRIAKPIP